MNVDIAIIGGGAAGLAASLSAYGDGLSILLIEREQTLGGILNQCIHNGFGLHVFKEELTGPEYATKFVELFHEKNIAFKLHTTVIDIKKEQDFLISVSSLESGLETIRAHAVILASGCYERTRGSIQIPGERPKGIMPAGSAQRYLNMEGYLVGKRIFILGSGDIGLIMARRMTLEGARVLGVAEIMPYSNGLTRNIVQCLDDFDIPLYLSHTVTDIRGKDVLEGITLQKVDDHFQPIPGTEQMFEVDTLLLSIGLIPDIALFESLNIEKSPVTKSAVVNQFYETNIPGLFACGNALHVHDLVDWVSKESEKAGACAKRYVRNPLEHRRHVHVVAGSNIRYVVPQRIDMDHIDGDIELSFRVSKKMEQGIFKLYQDGKLIKSKKARYIAPAEMEHLVIKKDDVQSDGPFELVLEEVNP